MTELSCQISCKPVYLSFWCLLFLHTCPYIMLRTSARTLLWKGVLQCTFTTRASRKHPMQASGHHVEFNKNICDICFAYNIWQTESRKCLLDPFVCKLCSLAAWSALDKQWSSKRSCEDDLLKTNAFTFASSLSWALGTHMRRCLQIDVRTCCLYIHVCKCVCAYMCRHIYIYSYMHRYIYIYTSIPIVLVNRLLIGDQTAWPQSSGLHPCLSMLRTSRCSWRGKWRSATALYVGEAKARSTYGHRKQINNFSVGVMNMHV